MVQNIFLEEDRSQNYFVFQPVNKHFKPLTNDIVRAWKSKGFSDESIKPPATLDNSLHPRLDYFDNSKFQEEFNGSCLEPDRVSSATKNTINFYITFKVKSWPFYADNGFIVRNSLFGAVKLTKNADPDKYSYSGYGISFDICETFQLLNGRFGKKVVIFAADMSSSVHVYNQKNTYLNSC